MAVAVYYLSQLNLLQIALKIMNIEVGLLRWIPASENTEH